MLAAWVKPDRAICDSEVCNPPPCTTASRIDFSFTWRYASNRSSVNVEDNSEKFQETKSVSRASLCSRYKDTCHVHAVMVTHTKVPRFDIFESVVTDQAVERNRTTSLWGCITKFSSLFLHPSSFPLNSLLTSSNFSFFLSLPITSYVCLSLTYIHISIHVFVVSG